jgi:O-antigen/teichoic acid export membrane protein
MPIRQVFSTTVFIVALNIGTGLITARLLGPVGRGEVTAMMLALVLVVGMFTFGLQPAITYNLASRRGAPPCLISMALLLTLCAGILAAGFGALFIPIWLKGYPSHVKTFAQWAMLMAPVSLLVQSSMAILQAHGKFKLYNRNRYIPPLATLVGLVVLGYSGLLTPLTAALALIAPYPPLLITNLIWIVRTHQPRFCKPARSSRQLLSYGLRSYGSHVVETLAREVDRIALVALVGPAALGLYVVARSMAEPTVALPNAIVAVLFPEASRAEPTDAVTLLARAAQMSMAVACTLGLVLALAGPSLLELLYGEAFAPAADPFRFLIVDAILVGFSWILMQAFMSAGRPGTVSGLLLLGLVVNVLGMMFLVPVYGLSGAALAVLMSTIVRLALTLSCFPLVLKVSLASLLPRRRDLEGLLARGRGPR